MLKSSPSLSSTRSKRSAQTLTQSNSSQLLTITAKTIKAKKQDFELSFPSAPTAFLHYLCYLPCPQSPPSCPKQPQTKCHLMNNPPKLISLQTSPFALFKIRIHVSENPNQNLLFHFYPLYHPHILYISIFIFSYIYSFSLISNNFVIILHINLHQNVFSSSTSFCLYLSIFLITHCSRFSKTVSCCNSCRTSFSTSIFVRKKINKKIFVEIFMLLILCNFQCVLGFS